MSPQDLLTTLRSSGVEITVVEDRLRIEAPHGVVTPEIRQALAEHKPELLAELTGQTLPEEAQWPSECRESEQRFGGLHARLYPLLGHSVVTPEGHGELVQVFSERASVRLDVSPDQLTVFLPEEIRPAGVGMSDSHLPIRRLH